ncbi:MAG: polysaccharide biosynthesis/export family protein [bacterium]|nr:polysaccharide biosynthesis/export family protein [bacterium]
MKKSRLLLLFSIVLIVLMSTSCVTSKKVRYLRDMPTYGVPLNDKFEATIVPYDELRIYVLGDGKNEELVKPFNVLGTAGANTTNRMGYLVDVNGNIEFPVLGELHVAGLTRLQLQDLIAEQLKSNGYLSNPNVMVRFLNFKVFYLGTESGKVLNINEERCTFLEALAMAGGLDLYTRRDRIGVMREVNGKMVIHYLDPRSVEIFDDEFFLLQQNDIIFTEAGSRRFLKESYSNWQWLVSGITSVVSLYLLYKSIEKDIQNSTH